MTKYNCIVVYSQKENMFLFCKREKNPYKGLLNFVGGKVEPGESDEHAAYRELYEETGISSKCVNLQHLMDMIYYEKRMVLEIFSGIVERNINLAEEKQALFWVSGTEDFFDLSRFAGDGNIGHIILQILGRTQKSNN